jgi:hypothetical protein
MKNLYRSMVAVMVLSAPLFAGCAMQTGTAEEGEQQKPALTENARPKPEMVSADARFTQWLVRPDGKLAGMLLDDGAIVHVRGDAVKDTSVLKAGDAVHVEGFSFAPKSSDQTATKMFGMAKVTKDGKVIVAAPELPKNGEHGKGFGMKHHDGPKDGLAMKDHNGDKKHDWKHDTGNDKKAVGLDESKLPTVSSTATIAQVIAGRHGKGVSMLILSDGTVAYAPHHGNVDALATLKEGDAITVSGLGGSYPEGKALKMTSVTMPTGKVEQI